MWLVKKIKFIIKYILKSLLSERQIRFLVKLASYRHKGKVIDYHKIRRKKFSSVKVPKGRFSILTTVWNTDPEFFWPLINSVVSMDQFEKVEWIILDNGTTTASTKSILDKIDKKYKNIKIISVEENIGIIDGQRRCLLEAKSEFVIPIDSDDYLYPDAITIYSHFVDKNPNSSIFYSDEDKINGENHLQPYRKPKWDPVLFYHSCYIAHLCAFKTSYAIEYGVYSDNNVNGCHDWDTFSRFYLNGHSPTHVPEVLYSWRIHAGSAAGNIDSKNYIHNSHKSLLNNFLVNTNKSDFYQVDYSPLFKKTPDWRFHAKSVRGRHNIVVCSDKDVMKSMSGRTHENCEILYVQNLEQISKKIEDLNFSLNECNIVFVNQKDMTFSSDYFTEANTMFELFPNVVGVGGRFIEGDIVKYGKLSFDGNQYTNVLGGVHKDDPGYFAQNLKPHSCEALPVLNTVWNGNFIKNKIDSLSFILFDADLANDILNSENRVVFNPLMEIRPLS